MNKENIKKIKEQIDLRDIAGRYTELQGMNEKYGTCPKCGGTDRFHVGANMFFCRQCLPIEGGKGRHDIFDFLIWIGEARDFREAYRIAEREAGMQTTPNLSSVRHYTAKDELGNKNPDPQKWQRSAKWWVDKTHQALFTDTGKGAREYLTSRGLSEETWRIARLGFTRAYTRHGQLEAVSIPWIDERGEITAIQNRIIDPIEERYTRQGFYGHYGDPKLYHLPRRQSDRLLVVEGEINGLSCYQAIKSINVVSLGSQNIKKEALEALRITSKNYKEVYLWLDDIYTAQRLIEELGGVKKIDSSGTDANEFLQDNQLENFLKWHLDQPPII